MAIGIPSRSMVLNRASDDENVKFMNEPMNTNQHSDEDDGHPLAGPAGLLFAGGGLLAIPYFSGSRWEWNGIPTEYVAYLFLGIGALWLPFGLRTWFQTRNQ